MALIFRWRVLAGTSYGGHSATELDLILGMSSYGTSTRLLKHWVRKPKYFLLMGSWILLGIVCAPPPLPSVRGEGRLADGRTARSRK
jgi:hypothetical protein